MMKKILKVLVFFILISSTLFAAFLTCGFCIYFVFPDDPAIFDDVAKLAIIPIATLTITSLGTWMAIWKKKLMLMRILFSINSFFDGIVFGGVLMSDRTLSSYYLLIGGGAIILSFGMALLAFYLGAYLKPNTV